MRVMEWLQRQETRRKEKNTRGKDTQKHDRNG